MKLMTLKYPILHSGFLALSEVGLTKKIPAAPTFSDTILFRDTNHSYDNLFYSADISKLFIEWQSNFHVMKDFEFKERILTCALKAFGPSMAEWLAFQSNKPGFSNTHKQFLTRMTEWLTDTDVAPTNSSEAIKWLGLIGPSQGNNNNFNINETSAAKTSLVTVNAIRNWVCKEGGYESLLVHLYIIFGERVGHTQRTSMEV